MKYYSEFTKKFYDTEDECLAAEIEFEEAEAKRQEAEKKRAKEIDELRERLAEIASETKKLNEERKDVIKKLSDYGIIVGTRNHAGLLLSDLDSFLFG